LIALLQMLTKGLDFLVYVYRMEILDTRITAQSLSQWRMM
jgi:hypothetical protein